MKILIEDCYRIFVKNIVDVITCLVGFNVKRLNEVQIITAFMSDKNVFFVGLRVDRDIVNFLDRYHYGTRSEVVRNIIYERIGTDDPTKMFRDLIKSYEAREIDTRTFLKRYMVLKERCKEVLDKYSDLDHELYNVNVNELVGRLRLEDEIDNYF